MKAEVLAPAGDFETALSAFAAGADAVYCGLGDFSARAFAKNFSVDELSSLISYAHSPSRGWRRRGYVTFNTLIDEADIPAALESLSTLSQLQPDGVIVQDLGVASLCRKFFPSLELHASTQLVAHNLEGVLQLKEMGFRRVVLARELSLAEIRTIAERCGALKIAADSRPEMELECFIHGALCYSVSGLCLFGAMEDARSGNRGRCPYCCRRQFGSIRPFSMKDLRLGDGVRSLADAGVTSLKIEGRMKSPLYVAAVTSHYRQLLDGKKPTVSKEDIETVFSRRTTKLYFDGFPSSESVLDPDTVGHVGTKVGVVKKITKDRDGRSWLRLHTSRALEKHDGLQFDIMTREGRRAGFGIGEMRLAISRRPVFEVSAGDDVEIEVPRSLASLPLAGGGVYCSMSNAVKRMFPQVTCRESDCAGVKALDVEVSLSVNEISARLKEPFALSVSLPCSLAKATNASATYAAAQKAFSRLGGTRYFLRKFALDDDGGLFAPASLLNALRRALVSQIESEEARAREESVKEALKFVSSVSSASESDASLKKPLSVIKVNAAESVPEGDWDEVVFSVGCDTPLDDAFLSRMRDEARAAKVRLSLPVYTPERDFSRLRVTLKRLLRNGFSAWECSSLAALRLLKSCGVEDITADWPLYAANSPALEALSAMGVSRFVASPENVAENLQALSRMPFHIEFLTRQSTPLFISLTRPASEEVEGYRVFRRDGLYVTTRSQPRFFDAPEGTSRRVDYSWDGSEGESINGGE